MHGKAAQPTIVRVPVGTIVYRAIPVEPIESGAANADHESRPIQFESGEQIADLTHDAEEFLLCRGGAGGKGNVHFKSSRNRAPRQYTEGGEGESGYFFLELRTIADAALVGYPNAGKSTLLRRLSAAQPKVASYPFTTLHPVIGVVDLDEYRRITVADIPGLIEGAHRNLGLGHDFLRHITRCRLLLFVLDMAGSEGRSPIADLESLRREIDLYDSRLSERPWFVIANKMDLAQAEDHLGRFRERFPELTVIPVSAKQERGISQLKSLLGAWIPVQPGLARSAQAGFSAVHD
jgi:GTP-binding protein